MTKQNQNAPTAVFENAGYENEKHPLEMVERLDLGLALADAQTGNILKVNSKLCDILGYSTEELLQTNFSAITHPDDIQKSIEKFHLLVSSGIQNFSGDKRYIKKNGEPVLVNITVSSLWNPEESPSTIMATFKEIAERNNIEESLRQSEENFRSFFNTISELLFILDTDGSILLSNDAAINRLGYSATELIGMNVLELHPPDRREEAARIVAGMMEGIIESCPIPIMTKNGQIVAVETRVSKGTWSGKPVVFGVTKDISKLKESEEMFSGVFNINPIPMAISTLEGQFINVNDAFLKTTGYTRQEVIGKTSTDLQLFDDLYQRDIILNQLNTVGKAKNQVVNVRTKSGAIRAGEFSAMFLHLQGQVCLLTVMIDITEKKQMEETFKYQITHDILTGLYNRQYYEIELERLQHSRQFPISIMVMDVDDLKWVNDHNGHYAGDELLQRAGAILKMSFRPEDVVARIGGDEFVVILPETDEMAIIEIKGRLEKILDNHNAMFPPEKLLGISIGYSTGHYQDQLTEIFKRADQVMYLNKSYKKKLRTRKEPERNITQEKLL